MSTIRTMEARMPPGFRFHPRDDELVLDYLLHKLAGRGHTNGGVAMVDVDLNKCEPWELPEESCIGGGKEWYFFSLRDRKYTTGERTNRATRSGYWKATGKDRAIVTDQKVVGMRKTLVFYWGRAPKGRKTEWVMHEFRLQPRLSQLRRELQFSAKTDHLIKDDWVLCRVLYKGRTTTTRPPSEDKASMPSCEPDMPAAPPVEPVIATYNTFDGSQTAAEQVFPGLPAVPFRRPVSLGELLAIDTSEKEAMGIMMDSMTSTISLGLELAPSWEQEIGLAQMWNPL